MPRVRVRNQSARINSTFRQSPNVTQGAGMEGQAQANLGRQLADVAEGVGDMLLRSIEKKDAAEARAQYEVAKNNIERQTREEFAGDPTGYADAVKKRMDEWSSKRVESAKGRASSAIRDFTTGANARSYVQARQYERARQAEIGQQTMENFTNTLGKARTEVPKISEYKNDYQAAKNVADAGIGTSYFTQEQANEAYKKSIKRIGFAHLEGMTRIESDDYSSNIKKLETAKSMLKDDQFTAGMTSEEKSRWLDSINRSIKSEKNRADQGTMRQLQDIVIASTGTERIDKDLISSVRAQLQGSTMETDKKQRALDSLKVAEGVNEVMTTLPEMTVREIAELDKSVDSLLKGPTGKPFNEGVRRQIKNQVIAAQNQRFRQINSNPVEYVTENDSRVANMFSIAEGSQDPLDMYKAINESIASQKERGVVEVKALTAGQRDNFVESLKGAKDTQTAQMIVSQLEQTYTKHTPMVFAELSKEDKDVAAILQATQFDDVASRKAVLSNTVNKREIKEQFQANKISEQSLSQTANKKLTAMNKALTLGAQTADRTGLLNMYQEQVNLEAMRLLNDPNSEVRTKEDAVNKAYERIVTANYHVDEGRNIVFPKQVSDELGRRRMQVDPTVVEAFLDDHMNPRFFKGVEFYGEGSVASREDIIKDLDDNGKWVLGPDQNSLRLMVKRDGVYQVPLTSTGTPVEYPIASMLKDGQLLRQSETTLQSITNSLLFGTPSKAEQVVEAAKRRERRKNK